MQIILLKEVPKVGRAGDIKTVKSGFALNFLIPKGLAEIATQDKKIAAEKKQADTQAQNVQQEKEWQELADTINGKEIALCVSANEKGSLYQQITPEMIAEGVSAEVQKNIPTDAPQIREPIKNIGEYPIVLQLGLSRANITLKVSAAV